MASDLDHGSTPADDGRDLTCRDVVELVTAYLEDALEVGERTRVLAHLDACINCSMYLDQMRQTVRVLRELAPDGLTPETRQQLLERFRSWRTTGSV